MLVSILSAFALMLAEAPATSPAPPPTVPATPAAAPAAVDPVTAEINGLLEPYKGKPGDALRGKLGLSAGVRQASDGEVVFWVLSIEQETVCGMDPATGAMRCLRGDPFQCRLAIAFDKQSAVKAWAVSGDPAVCRGFIGKLKGG
ncbi:MAG TPA: hypothetical protein PLO65_04910 [Caulobacter sp.]|nr:hypothetical protein [Caulobacter sp.]